MNVYDCWTEENEWLSLDDICKKMAVKGHRHSKNEYGYISNELILGAKHGILKRRKEKRKILCVGTWNHPNKEWYQYREVYVYCPLPWVLHSICNGFFDKQVDELEAKWRLKK